MVTSALFYSTNLLNKDKLDLAKRPKQLRESQWEVIFNIRILSEILTHYYTTIYHKKSLNFRANHLCTSSENCIVQKLSK